MTGYARILMTGASGFVGGWLAPALRAAYPEAAFATITHGSTGIAPAWTTFRADLTDAEAVADAVRVWRPDLVVHLAAQSSVGQASYLGETTWRINAVGALNLAAAIARSAPDATVFNVSTGELYGSSFLDGPASEATPISPRNVYARSKAAAEAIFDDVLPRETRLITVRPLNHTGAGQDERFVLPSFAAQIARIEAGLLPPKLQVGDLSAERDFLDVSDVVDAYLLIIAGAGALPSRSLFNIASGKPRRIRDLLDMMARASIRPFEVEVDLSRVRRAEIPRAVGDATLLRRSFGWSPKHSVNDLVAGLLVYWRTKVSDDLPSS